MVPCRPCCYVLLSCQSPWQVVNLVSKLMPLSCPWTGLGLGMLPNWLCLHIQWLITFTGIRPIPSLLLCRWSLPFPVFGSVFAGLSCFCLQVMSAQILVLLYIGLSSTFNLGQWMPTPCVIKAAILSDLMVSHRIDLLSITETWLTVRETSADLGEVTPPGFSFFQIPKPKRRGGGVGLFISSAYKVTPILLPAHTSFKSMSGTVELGRSCLNILNIYRQPGPTSTFFSKFQDTMFYMSTLPYNVVVMGHFNLHIDTVSSDIRQFADIVESFDLDQRVDFPTHIYGHSLDLMIFSKGFDVLSVSVSDKISDHFSVVADLNIPRINSRTVPKTIRYCNLKAINIEAFKGEIMDSDLMKIPKGNVADLAMQYHRVLSTLLDLHVPLITKSLYPKPPNLWISPDNLASKRQRHYLECVWCKNPTTLNRSRLTRQTHLCNRLMTKAKSAHFSEVIAWPFRWLSILMESLRQNPSPLSRNAPFRPLFSCCTSRYLWIFFH